jgi:long-chain acyl-CoA synthetase
VLDVELQERWFDATGVELRQGYGLTEAAPVCLYNRTDRPNVRGALGTAFPGVEVSIRPPASYDAGTGDETRAEPLPDGAAGEICVRGDNVFAGYVHRDGDGLPRRDGWLHTGDLGVRDADGTVRFLGLLKPMFTRNGFNVYPREVERVVGTMQGVRSVAVTPLPDPVRENGIRLQVRGAVTEPDLRAWCESRLSAYKQPTVVEISVA